MGDEDTAAVKVLGDVPSAFFGLLKSQMELGRGIYEAWTGTKAPAIQDAWKAWEKAAPKPVCHVPDPCWMPDRLGECQSYIDACSSACIRLVVTNCDRVRHTIQARVEGAPGATVEPTALTLEPMSRGTIEICRKVPEGTERGSSFENLIWVEGCRDHVLRWIVSVGPTGLDSCHEVAVDDCPDYRHHWYDHFYCQRSCVRRQPVDANG